MTPRTIVRLIAVISGCVSLVTSAQAQQWHLPFDSTSIRFRFEPPALPVKDPLVLALVDSSGEVPVFDRTRQVAESLGYQFVVRKAAGLQLQDPRYSAVYYLPDYLKRGFVIMMPGRRP